MAIQITDRDTDPDMDPDPDPYRDTGKTCLGRGMHCPSASSYVCFYLRNRGLYKVIYNSPLHGALLVQIIRILKSVNHMLSCAVGHLEPRFQGEGVVPGEYFWFLQN